MNLTAASLRTRYHYWSYICTVLYCLQALYLFISSPLLKVRPLLIPLSSSSICKGTVATSGGMDTTPTPSSKSIATSVIAATSATRFGDRPSDRASATVRWASRAFGSPPKKGFKPENHVRLGQDMISQNYSESLLMGIQTIRNHWKSIFMDSCRHILGDSRTGVKKPGGKSNSESFRISGSDNWSGFKPFLLSIYTTLYHIYMAWNHIPYMILMQY